MTAAKDSLIGWHPAPNGQPELWYWDGCQWIDPVDNVAEQITELITPHLERIYCEGFEAGLTARTEHLAPALVNEIPPKRRASHVLRQYLTLVPEFDWTPGSE